MRIALNLYALRHHLKTDHQIVDALQHLKDMGYDAIQLSGFSDWTYDRIALIAATCKELGIDIAGTHPRLTSLDNIAPSLIEQHKMLHTNIMGIGSMPEKYNRQDLTHYQDFILSCHRSARLLSEQGITLTYHHHAFEFSKIQGLYPMDIILQTMHQSPLMLEVDVYWLQYAGINPLTFIQKHHQYIAMLHIKDMKIAITGHWGTMQQFCPIGEGNIQYRQLISQLRTLDIPWIIIGQDEFYGADPYEELRKSLSFVKAII